ncbi:MAG: hypothetical protein ACJ77N_12375 [Chloroflexota bacterium]
MKVVEDERRALVREPLELARERDDDGVTCRPTRPQLRQEEPGLVTEGGIRLPTRRDEVIEERNPVAVVRIEAIPG